MKQITDLPIGSLYRIPELLVFNLLIELALVTGVRLLVCGNRLPFYEIAYTLAGLVGQSYETILTEQIFFSRAETCTQLVHFLSELEPNPTPLLVTDFLARFNDEDQTQVDELFFACQIELQRLSRASLVFVSATLRPSYEKLGNALKRITQEVSI